MLRTLLLLSLFTTPVVFAQSPLSAQSEKHPIKIDIIADRLDHPWGLAFLPDARILITERDGRLLLLSADGEQRSEIAGLPDIAARGQGGLLDVAVDPQFVDNQLVYLSYVASGRGGRGTEVMRARLEGDALAEQEVIFRLDPKSGTTRHFGSRLVFAADGTLFITLGDRGEKGRAQILDDHAGSVIRIHTDGSVPEGNPFIDKPQARPEIYSYGHRNIQGATLHPKTGALWTHEHGPQGGDEINIVEPGKNYGWPVITYGVNYGIGTKIGEGTEKPGMQQPLYYWVPSIAPSGMAFYSGALFPEWEGNLFVGSLKFRALVRLTLDGDKVVSEERLLRDQLGRIRDVAEGPDGALYLLTDEGRGVLARLTPQ